MCFFFRLPRSNFGLNFFNHLTLFIVLSRWYFVISGTVMNSECLILAPTDLEKCPLPAMDDTDEE